MGSTVPRQKPRRTAGVSNTGKRAIHPPQNCGAKPARHTLCMV